MNSLQENGPTVNEKLYAPRKNVSRVIPLKNGFLYTFHYRQIPFKVALGLMGIID